MSPFLNYLILFLALKNKIDTYKIDTKKHSVN